MGNWTPEKTQRPPIYSLKEFISKQDSATHQVVTIKAKPRSLQGQLHSYLWLLFLRIFSHNQDQKWSWSHMLRKSTADFFGIVPLAWLIHMGSSVTPLPLTSTALKPTSCLRETMSWEVANTDYGQQQPVMCLSKAYTNAKMPQNRELFLLCLA